MKTIKINQVIEYLSPIMVFSYFFIHNIFLVLIGITFSFYLININMINNLKKNGLDEKKFKMTFENLISSNNSIEFFVQKNISENSYISPSKNNNRALLTSKFFGSTDEIILRSFTKILQDISGRYFPARGKGVSRIINQIKQKSLTKTTLGGCVIEKIENSVVISKENTK